MLVCMRTTLNLDDELLRRARAEAARKGATLTSLIEDGLALLLDRRQAERGTHTLPVWRGSRVLPEINFDDSSAVWEILDSDDH